MQSSKVQFVSNVPVQVALKYGDGKQVKGAYGEQVYYSLSYSSDDATGMYLDPPVAAKIRALEIRPNEKLWICKRRGAGKGAATVWDVWRDRNSSMEEQLDPQASTLERDLARSIDRVQTTRSGHGELAIQNTGAGLGASHPQPAPAIHKNEPESDPASIPARKPASVTTSIHGSAQPKTQLEAALVTAVAACHAAQEYARQIGFGVTFTSEDLRAMAITLVINKAQEKARGAA